MKKHSSIPFNPDIANAFFRAGYIETWGRGTIKMIEECKKARLPEPKFEILNGGIAVTFFKDIFSQEKLIEKGLNERQLKAVEYVKENNKITNSIYRKLFEVSEKTAFRDLDDLVSKKILIKQGDKKGSYYTLNV